MLKNLIQDKTFDQERALYHLCDATVVGCTFEGPADGESAMKESHRLEVERCRFALRYPFWHTTDFTVRDCVMEPTCRAALWYSRSGVLENCCLGGIKALRECDDMTVRHCTVDSAEFGWNCRGVRLEDTEVRTEYFLMGSSDLYLRAVTLNGKYSFQYTRDVRVEDCRLDTKDAFWHAQNVVVRNCEINGEYLGWYSEGLTLIGCTIRGTQPFCYCRNLTLIDCEMIDTDLAFECSQVSATVRGHILSVKNPESGSITADSIGEIIIADPVRATDCRVIARDRA